MKRFWLGISVIVYLFSLQSVAFASVGVGVGTGKIAVTEKLKAGGIYTLPSITVFNTGTEKATYRMYVTLNEKQDQLKPNPAWFSFSPAEFTLEPKKSQRVTPTFSPPIVTKPGAYFAYLEARPSKTVTQGSTIIGVAAATKLNFSVTSSSVFVGAWYRLRDIYRQNQPWISIFLVALLVVITYTILRKYIQIDIKRAKKKTESDSSE